jgi:1-acyl-sn-glycerol-3-phosphate acyltransferase
MASLLPVVLASGYETLAISLPTVVDSWSGRVSRQVCDERLDSWSRKLLDHARIELEVVGRENIDTSGATIVMSNHQSLYDIPVLYQVLPRSLRMIAKIELFKVPIWGPAMRASGMIAIDRHNRTKAMQSLKEARAALESGVTVWMAPEGTRSRDGKLLPFKKGGFVLAEEIGAAILPITIDGTRNILPAKTLRFNPGARVRVQIHPKVRLEQPGQPGSRERLMQRVREAVESGLR